MTASLLLHSAWMLSLRTPGRPRSAAPEAPYVAAFELSYRPAPPPIDLPHTPLATVAGGPNSASALDLDQPGRGGERAAAQPASVLFSFASPLTLQDTELNNLAHSQTQRIETARTRATQEERRATPHAAEAVFLASGTDGHHERRKPARDDAREGALRGGTSASQPRTQAAGSGGPPAPSDDSAASQASADDAARLARGILRGRGARSSAAARVAHARPNVDPGPAATPAQAIDPKVRDNADAELLAAMLQRSIVDASTQRAEQRGPGAGGVDDPGSGLDRVGAGRGAHALPYMPGLGAMAALDTRDARYVRWFVEQKERVQNELIFPKSLALSKDQGVSIYRVVVRRDGQLAGAPYLVRSSGYADFDRAAIVAIRRAVPFSPLPDRLLPDAADLTLLIPVAFSNPLVQ